MAIRVSTKSTGMNPYNTYMDLSQAANQIDTDIDRSRKIAEEQEQKRSRELQLGILQQEQMEGLMIPSTTKFQPLNAYTEGMSRKLVDQQSQLVDQLAKREITSSEFAASSAKISSQVPQIKALVAGVDGVAGGYAAGLAAGTLSAAITPEQEQFYQAIINNKGEFAMDDNGVLVFQGETEGDPPIPFSIPANKIQQMPQPIQKVPSFQELVGPMTANMTTPRNRTLPDGREVTSSVPLESDEFQQTVRAGFDDFLKKYNKPGLKSLAADYAGYTNEQIEADLNSGMYEGPDGENYSSKLEYDMEELYAQKAVDNYIVKEQNNWKQMDYDLKLKQLAQNDATRAAQLHLGRTEKQQEQVKSANELNQIAKNYGPPRPDSKSLTQWINGNTQGFSYSNRNDKHFLVKNGKGVVIPEEILNDPNELAKFLSSTVWGASPSMNRWNFNTKASPMQKIAKFFTGKK